MKRGTHVLDGRIPHLEEVEVVWTCAKADKDEATRNDITDDSRQKAKTRQTKAEMGRPSERGYGKKPDNNSDG